LNSYHFNKKSVVIQQPSLFWLSLFGEFPDLRSVTTLLVLRAREYCGFNYEARSAFAPFGASDAAVSMTRGGARVARYRNSHNVAPRLAYPIAISSSIGKY
jgi:hypothetical protein